MQYLLAPQNGKYEAPKNAAALLRRHFPTNARSTSRNDQALPRDRAAAARHAYDMERDGFLVDRDELNRLGAAI